jgi:hypothetical protein
VLSVSTNRLLSPLSLILWHALLAVPLHLTRCRKIFFTADGLNKPGAIKISVEYRLLSSPCCWHAVCTGCKQSRKVAIVSSPPEIEPKRPSVGTTRVMQP